MMLTSIVSLVILGVFGLPWNSWFKQRKFLLSTGFNLFKKKKISSPKTVLYFVTFEIQGKYDYQDDVVENDGKLSRCVGNINPFRSE